MTASSSKHNTPARSTQPDSSSTVSDDEEALATPVCPHIESPKIEKTKINKFLEDIAKPITKDQIWQCSLRREKRGILCSYVYQLFGEDPEPILIAKSESSPAHAKYAIIEPVTGEKIGYIISDFKRLSYKITGPNCNFTVEYIENFCGRNGARAFKVILENLIVLINKPPILYHGDYYQDFHDLEPMESIKNFILVNQEDFSKEACLFVRLDHMNFAMRLSAPFSIFHGFALALTNLHSGLYHR